MITIGETEGGQKFNVDLERLIETRALIQANSGGGKSYLIRKLLEEACGSVQVIVLDLEGEFGTLREKYDFLLIGEGGEVPVSIRTAELLAKKLLELQVSTIINLYELKHHERILFVKRFLDSMMNAPKELWHPCIVVVDEAHILCPEHGKCESAGSVIDLCTRGRKRGFAAILATQRLSKLHKDAAAECINKLIGRTGLDVDMKRASDELGFTTKQQMLSLRDLEQGEFYAFGAALSKAIVKVKIGKVKTTHPHMGTRLKTELVPPTEKIKAILSKLSDLPKEVDTELKTLEDYKRRLHELKNQLRQQAAPPKPPIDIMRLREAEATAEAKGYNKGLEVARKVKRLSEDAMARIQAAASLDLSKAMPKELITTPRPPLPKMLPDPTEFKMINDLKMRQAYKERQWLKETPDDDKLSKCEQAIINALALFGGDNQPKRKIAIRAGYAHSGGAFNNSLGSLHSRGLIARNRDLISLKPEGAALANETLPDDLKGFWMQNLDKAARILLGEIMSYYPNAISKEELGERSGYADKGGAFNNAIGKLNTLGLIEKTPEGIKASEELM